MGEPTLLIETSGRGGRVGLAVDAVLHERALDPARRHARDLAPAIAELLAEAGLKPRDVRRIGVSVGPGSFTGLRVGIMSAKAFAYATGCELVAVPTFAVIAEQTADDEWEPQAVTVVADALQGLVYAQRFARQLDRWGPADTLCIDRAEVVAAHIEKGGWVSGPGYALVEPHLPITCFRAADDQRLPRLPAMLVVARRLTPLSRDEMLGLEPLYLRGSSAEEKAARDAKGERPA